MLLRQQYLHGYEAGTGQTAIILKEDNVTEPLQPFYFQNE
jgi:hypothetical protein